jgi:hypothetical protein
MLPPLDQLLRHPADDYGAASRLTLGGPTNSRPASRPNMPGGPTRWAQRVDQICHGGRGKPAECGQAVARPAAKRRLAPACGRRATRGAPCGLPGAHTCLLDCERRTVAKAAGALVRPTHADDSSPTTARPTSRRPAGAQRAWPASHSRRLAHRSTNVCSNQQGFTSGLHMCSNYLHVSGNLWPPATIR